MERDPAELAEEEMLEREKRPADDATYGDTDMDPNRDDQRDAHHGDDDEVV